MGLVAVTLVAAVGVPSAAAAVPGPSAAPVSSAAVPEPAPEAGAVWRLDLVYEGTGFRGWARQPGLRTVEGVLREDATPRLGATGG